MEIEGFESFEAEDEATAFALMEKVPFNLILLDVNLQHDDGFDIARKIRTTSDVPIIMVTGKDDVIDRVVGLEIGADDYITKPFHVREVLARVRTVLRRASGRQHAIEEPSEDTPKAEAPSTGHVARFDGLIAILDQHELRDRDGNLCELTSGDFKLLGVFLTRPKRILSREQLMDLIGGVAWAPLDRTIDNQIARLRKKIERDISSPQLIKTVRGVGYMFATEVTLSESQGADSNASNFSAKSACR